MSKKRIINILKDLEDANPEERISVTVTEKQGTIRVHHENEHGVDFVFRWYAKVNHYVGMFIDDKGKASQAVVTLERPIDAIQFVAAYKLLDQIRAMRRAREGGQ